MMKANFVLPISLGLVLVILAITYVVTTPKTSPEPTEPVLESSTTATTSVDTTPTVAKPAPVAPSPAPQASGYTVAQVTLHNTKTSCWTIVSGSVYDVTAWIEKHPGGAGAIMSMCGRDATASFVDQHGGQRRPEAELVNFRIGAVVQ